MTATFMTSRVIDQCGPWFAAAFERHAQGEQVSWEIGLVAYPTGMPGNFMGALAVWAALPGAVLDTNVAGTNIVQPFGLTEKMVDEFVRVMVAELLDGRSRQIEEMTNQQTQAQSNGQPAPNSGLILGR